MSNFFNLVSSLSALKAVPSRLSLDQSAPQQHEDFFFTHLLLLHTKKSARAASRPWKERHCKLPSERLKPHTKLSCCIDALPYAPTCVLTSLTHSQDFVGLATPECQYPSHDVVVQYLFRVVETAALLPTVCVTILLLSLLWVLYKPVDIDRPSPFNSMVAAFSLMYLAMASCAFHTFHCSDFAGESRLEDRREIRSACSRWFNSITLSYPSNYAPSLIYSLSTSRFFLSLHQCRTPQSQRATAK